jgi:aryl-alcohol dehydrogenase-like predicted oxidoreductase
MRTGRLDMIQIPYNPRRREAERRVFPLAVELGLGVLVHSPLRNGVLDNPPNPQELKAFGVKTWAQAILKWIASDQRVSCVLSATKTPGRPTENAQAGNSSWFDPDQRERLVRLLG